MLASPHARQQTVPGSFLPGGARSIYLLSPVRFPRIVANEREIRRGVTQRTCSSAEVPGGLQLRLPVRVAAVACQVAEPSLIVGPCCGPQAPGPLRVSPPPVARHWQFCAHWQSRRHRDLGQGPKPAPRPRIHDSEPGRVPFGARVAFWPGPTQDAPPQNGRTVRSLNLNLGRLRHSGYYMMAGRGPGQAAQVEVPLGHCRSSLTGRLTLDGAPGFANSLKLPLCG